MALRFNVSQQALGIRVRTEEKTSWGRSGAALFPTPTLKTHGRIRGV